MIQNKMPIFGLIAIVLLSLISSVPAAFAQNCGVDVYGLDVIGGQIRASIRNTGSETETFSYSIIVNGDEVNSGSLEVESDHSKGISVSYNFGYGDHVVEMIVDSECGSHDEESMNHIVLEGDTGPVCGNGICESGENYINCPSDCSPGPQYCSEKFLPSSKCYGKVKQMKYQYHDCTTEWVSVEYCEYGCYGGICLPPDKEEISGKEICGLIIDQIDYLDDFIEGEQGFAKIGVINSGTEKQTIGIEFFVDGVEKGSVSLTLDEGESGKKTFYYYPKKGEHRINIIIQSDCGKSGGDSFWVNVFPKENTIEYESPQPDAEEKFTAVSVVPKSLDIPQYESKVISVAIVSATSQNFHISVTGLPSGWASYEENVYVTNEKTSFIYISPDKSGNYNFEVTVTSDSEGKTYSQSIGLFVSPIVGTEDNDINVQSIADMTWVILIIVVTFVLLIWGAVTASLSRKRGYSPNFHYEY